MSKTALVSYRPSKLGESSLEHAYEAFRLRCRAQNLSAATCAWYDANIARWHRFLAAREIARVRDVSPSLIRAYLDDMRAHKLASGTIRRTYGALRCFFGFLARERTIPVDPFLLVEKPRMERKLIRPLSTEQVKALLAAFDHKLFPYYTVWTISVLILDTGLRVSEVVGLKADQLDFDAGVLRVMGKGGKERQVPFGATSKQTLWNYAARRGEVPDQSLFFVNRYGGGLCRVWVQKVMRRIGQRAGIQGVRVSPHTLRHTFAINYVRNGGDAFSLQRILGHSCLDMVKVYVSLADQDVAAMYRKFSPMDRLGPVPGAKRRVMVR